MASGLRHVVLCIDEEVMIYHMVGSFSKRDERDGV